MSQRVVAFQGKQTRPPDSVLRAHYHPDFFDAQQPATSACPKKSTPCTEEQERLEHTAAAFLLRLTALLPD
jgi:hypothetical protein